MILIFTYDEVNAGLSPAARDTSLEKLTVWHTPCQTSAFHKAELVAVTQGSRCAILKNNHSQNECDLGIMETEHLLALLQNAIMPGKE